MEVVISMTANRKTKVLVPPSSDNILLSYSMKVSVGDSGHGVAVKISTPSVQTLTILTITIAGLCRGFP